MPLSRKLAGLAGWILTAMLVSAAVTIGACNRAGVDLGKIAPGTEVTLIRQGGGVVQGPVERVEPNTIVIRVGERAMTVPRSDISSIQVQEPGVAAKSLPPAAKYREFVVPTGTQLSLRLMTAAGSEASRGDVAVSAELTQPVVIDGVEVLPAGTAVTGNVLRTELQFHTIRAGTENYAVGIKAGVPAGAVPAGTVLKLMLDRDIEVKVNLKADY